MDKIKIIGGDYPSGDCYASIAPGTGLVILSSTNGGSYSMHLKSIEQLTVEKIKNLSGTAAGGIAGAALLGPLGAIGGMLIGGNKTEVSFLCVTQDEKQFIGATDPKVYQKLVAASLSKSSNLTVGEMIAKGMLQGPGSA
ncbi:hypothetical protein [uncultured Lamprocystis sp.]|jgi:hypothetical protein|uniref:hypothetical protein n=1 Tax=uncultured Lamprocystis sp. TaxID=543132 RepID=UPI0025E4E330|nr:hypothetical protein [uncultured Lamprocystis sp.]